MRTIKINEIVVFWAAVGTSISSSLSVLFAVNSVTMLFIIVSGLIVGTTIGMMSTVEADKESDLSRLKIWWSSLAKVEKSALTTFIIIFIFVLCLSVIVKIF
jgi:hypothetical protein